MCNNSLLFIKKEIKTSVCEIYDRQDMTVSIVLGLMIFYYFAKNDIVTIIGRIYFLFTYQFLIMFFVGTDICENVSLVSEMTGISEENPRVRLLPIPVIEPGPREVSALSTVLLNTLIGVI